MHVLFQLVEYLPHSLAAIFAWNDLWNGTAALPHSAAAVVPHAVGVLPRTAEAASRIVPQLQQLPRERITAVFFQWFEIAAICMGALGGTLKLRRERVNPFDVIGLLGLGLISGVGGGIVRDVLLGDGPPLALTHPSYLAYALTGAAAAILFGESVGRRMLATMAVVDALALALFTVAGSTRAQDAGLGLLPCLVLGVTTAVGGGSLRDLLSGRSPAIFQEGEMYAVVSALVAAIFLLLQKLGIPQGRAAGVATMLGFGLRLLVIRYGWRTRAVAAIKLRISNAKAVAAADPLPEAGTSQVDEASPKTIGKPQK